ncbi:MAG: hypothetical protein ACI8PZ_001695 [Myxococcota bacterium]|jgi:hypothetical protein
MNRITRLALVLVAMGCGGDDNETPELPEDTGSAPTAVPVDFLSALDAGKVDGEIDADAVRAHEIAEALTAAIGVVLSDYNVQFMLNTDNGSGDGVTITPPCWGYVGVTHPTQVTMDYTSCFDYGIQGGAFIRDHPAGPVLFDFKNLSIADREVVGTVALAGMDAPNTWRMYESDGIRPDLENRVPIGVTVDGYTSGVRYDGAGEVERTPMTASWYQWGDITIEDAYGAVSLVQGGSTGGTLDPEARPDKATAASMSFDWTRCRCPLEGTLQYDASWTATSVEIDIDELKVNPDGFDDPVIVVDVSLPISARASLEATGCGEWEVDWPISGDLVHTISGQQLYSLIEVQCQTLAIEDRDHCTQLLFAASDVDSVAITIGESKLRNQASKALEEAIDSGFCIVPI